MAKALPRRVWFGLLVVGGLALTPPARAVPTSFGDIEITALPLSKGTRWHGYYDYVFDVSNHSNDKPHTVTLSLPFARHNASNDHIAELRRTVQVGAGETVRVSLLQPDEPPIEGANLAVIVDGQRQEREVIVPISRAQHRFPGTYSRYGAATMSEPLILVSRSVGVERLPRGDLVLPGSEPVITGGSASIPDFSAGMLAPALTPPGNPAKNGKQAAGSTSSPNLRWLPSWVIDNPSFVAWLHEPRLPPRNPGFPRSGIQFENAEDVETWNTDWLAYSRYDGVILGRDDVPKIPSAVRTALLHYVETGGTLLIVGRADFPGLSAVVSRTKDKAGWTTVRSGFGLCIFSPDADFTKWEPEHYQKLTNSWLEMVQSWQGTRNTLEANKEFPVVDDLGIPAKGLFTLMFLFTLAIGPANFLILARLKRRIWLLWTVPVISLFTCLAVFGYMLLSEGWEGQMRSETLTILDESTHRATTMGWTGVYSPLTPSDGLHFSYETEVVPQRWREAGRGGARACTIDLSHDQHFVSGWVEARVPALFKVRKSEARRERVTIERQTDGTWNMVNFLGADIRRLRYADAQGQMYEAENIAAGAPAILKPMNMEISPPRPESLRGTLLGSDWMGLMQKFGEKPQNYLWPDSYLAEVDGSKFPDDALPSAKKRKVHALVLGFREEH